MRWPAEEKKNPREYSKKKKMVVTKWKKKKNTASKKKKEDIKKTVSIIKTPKELKYVKKRIRRLKRNAKSIKNPKIRKIRVKSVEELERLSDMVEEKIFYKCSYCKKTKRIGKKTKECDVCDANVCKGCVPYINSECDAICGLGNCSIIRCNKHKGSEKFSKCSKCDSLRCKHHYGYISYRGKPLCDHCLYDKMLRT